MSEQALPTLSETAARMAANQAKVADIVAALDVFVDQLVAATAKEDWDSVRRISEKIATGARADGYHAVSAMATRVFDEAHRPDNAAGVKKSLIRLIGSCGRVDSRPSGRK